MRPQIEIDPDAGFCFGVERAVHTAEKLLKRGISLCSLGSIVHNEREVERLTRMGLRTISPEEIATVRPERVLIRAHGEPPSTFELANRQGVEVIDGTCPIVKRLQERIRNTYAEMDREAEQIVIFGKPDHPETIGLLGQVDGDAQVISHEKEAVQVDPGRSVHLFSQTTMDPEEFGKAEKALEHLLKKSDRSGLLSSCTVCGQVKRRKPGLAQFSRRHGVVIFVSGTDSANGRMLFEVCRSANPRSYKVSGPSGIRPAWLEGAGSVGISGAASTSGNQLEEVRETVRKFIFS